MLLFTNPVSTDDFSAEGMKVSEMISGLKTAFQDSINADKLVESLTSADSQAMKLQRSIGGVTIGANAFREKIIGSYKETMKLGASFKDSLDAVQGLAVGMGKMVNPSQETIENIVGLSKGIGETSEKIGEMVSNMTRFGGTQEEVIKKMDDMAQQARKAGLDAKAFLAEINTNLKKVSGFGFKDGVKGLTAMVKQAKLLRTDMSAIGAMSLQGSVLDPEGAIEAAANFQMLGGAVGKLSDPFQLMYMAQTDLQGLQDELVKSTKSSYNFNKETGNFDIATQDLYRLREQAKITGANFDDLVNAGKEAAKLDYLTEKFSLGDLDKDTQSMVAGLAQIGEGGKVEVDIPGYGKISADSAEQLKAQLDTKGAQDALKAYQEKAGKDSKDLALEQLTVTEKQAVDVKMIRDAILVNMGVGDRDDLIKAFKDQSESAKDSLKSVTTNLQSDVIDISKSGIQKTSEVATKIKEESGTSPIDPDKRNELLKKIRETMGGGDTGTQAGITKPINLVTGADMFLPAGGAPTLLNEGTLYKGIVGDEVAIGTNLTEAFNKSGKLNEIIASMASTKNNTGGNTSVDGKIDININLTGSISGDKNADVEKMFSDPKVQKQIMDTVLYKLDSYKRQQGVLS
jgi:hypothetical protein